MRTLSAFVLLLLLAGCANAPPNLQDVEGVPTPVRVLDAGFVRFEGERMAIEFFLLEIRERARAAEGDINQLPSVRVIVPADAAGVDGRWVSDLRDELHKAGIRHLAIGGA